MMKTLTRIAGTALLAACLLTLGGCPEPEKDKPVDSRLPGDWSNELQEPDLKTFSIDTYGYFTASLDPEGAGRGDVSGKLSEDGTAFIMHKMKGPADKEWGAAVKGYNGKRVQIVFTDDNKNFELKCKENNLVERFFGGKYYLKEPPAD